jgi:hypothetical protein
LLQLLSSRVADPHHFNADPDPAFHLNVDPDPAPHQSDGNLRPMGYRDNLDLPGLHFQHPQPYFEPLKILNFDFSADPDPAFHFIADPDPVS